jgi:acetyl esterase
VAGAIPKVDLSDLAAARDAERRMAAQMPGSVSETPVSVRQITVPGRRDGPDVAARVYAPAGRSGLLPGLVYLYGGAYVLGGLATADSSARMLADRAGVAVVAVGYRLAPEYPYPAGLEDCYTVLEWAAGCGARYGIDGGRLAVLGESSGGGLAAALSLLTRDRHGPRLIAQFLDAPTIDDRLGTPSMTTLSDTPGWQSVNSPYSWRYYLRGTAEPGDVGVPLYAAPARAAVEDLAGLPPAFVTAYQVDPTRDEALDYARLLIQAGVPAELRHYGAAFHLAHVIPGTAIGERMIADRIDAVRRMLRV